MVMLDVRVGGIRKGAGMEGLAGIENGTDVGDGTIDRVPAVIATRTGQGANLQVVLAQVSFARRSGEEGLLGGSHVWETVWRPVSSHEIVLEILPVERHLVHVGLEIQICTVHLEAGAEIGFNACLETGVRRHVVGWGCLKRHSVRIEWLLREGGGVESERGGS